MRKKFGIFSIFCEKEFFLKIKFFLVLNLYSSKNLKNMLKIHDCYTPLKRTIYKLFNGILVLKENF